MRSVYLSIYPSMIYYKDLAHMVIEAEKSRTCSPQVGDLGEPMVEVQSECKGLRTRRADAVSSSLSLSPKAGENQCPSSKIDKEKEFFLSALYAIRAFNRLHLAPTLGRAICSAQSTDSNVNLLQK